jgi:MATE family multidrug resistance protein
MSDREIQTHGLAAPRAASGRLRVSAGAEASMLAKIALPLIAAYMAEYAMFLTTKIVVGRLGYLELAALTLAAEMGMELFVILLGTLSVVGVLAAEAHGKGRKTDAGHAARQGFLVATLAGIPATALIWNLDAVFAWAGQDASVVELTRPLLHAFAGFLLPALWFAVLRNFVAALARTGAVMVITVSAVALNYVLCVGLVHGAFGLPALGIAGAGWAMTIVSWAMLAALALYAYCVKTYRGYGLFTGRLHFDPAVCGDIVRLGVPVAGLVLLESGLFAATALLAGLLSAEALAAHSILSTWIGVVFMLAIGIAEASMVRVAFWSGSRNASAARRAGVVAMALGVTVFTAMVVVPIGWPHRIVGLFLEAGDPGFATVSALAGQLLLIAALFQIFDGLQAIASRALRGLRDAIVPLWLAGLGYWVVGIGGGALLAFPYGLGLVGLWWGMALGLIATGTLLAARFFILSARMVRAQASAPS